MRNDGRAAHGRDLAPGDGPPVWRERSFQVLVALLLLAVPLLLHAGRAQWFWVDELDFFLARDLDEPATLLRSWYGHNVVLPAVTYRVVNAVWGTGSYRPYLGLAVTGHVLAVMAVWATCRRVGARGWVATATVLPLVVLGSGRTNIMIGFQITMTWALALGLLHLLLADHDGPFGRRDLLGLAAGLLALMCSGVAVPLVVATGVTVLLRRGWRLAALHTVPLGVLFTAWYALSSDNGPRARTTVDARTARWALELVKSGFWGLGQHRAAALALAALAVAGVAIAVRRSWRPPSGRWAALAPVAGVAAAVTTFVALTATQRRASIFGLEGARESRYVYVVVALLLPLIALAVEAAARHGAAVVAPLAVLAVGVPGNVRELDDTGVDYELVWALIGSEHIHSVPDGRNLPFATLEQLQGMASVYTPPEPVDPEVQLLADAMLALHQVPGDREAACPTVERLRVELEPGTSVGIRGAVDVQLVDGEHRSPTFALRAADGNRLSSYGPITVEVRRPEGAGPGQGPVACAG